MKKVLSLVLAATLAVSLSACGGALVDLDTPKSEELTAQYDFYPDAMNTIRADMKITPEQADEVFIVLTSCGLDGNITSISESKGAYTVYYGGSSLDVTLSDGAVETVYSGRDMLYPEYRKHNVLMDYDLTVKEPDAGSAGPCTRSPAFLYASIISTISLVNTSPGAMIGIPGGYR